MTDEELAEERATKFADINFNEPDNYGSEKEIGHFSYVAGFLAGLKAGRPKWHDLRKNSEDLPPARKVVFISGYLGDMKDLHGFDEWDGEKWLNMDMPGLVREAWCEIPTFGED